MTTSFPSTAAFQEASVLLPDGVCQVHASRGPLEPPFIAVSDWVGQPLGEAIGYQERIAASTDPRVLGAHVIAYYAHHLATAAGSVLLRTGIAPLLDPGRLGVLFEPADRHGVRRLHFRFVTSANETDDFGSAFARSLAPVVRNTEMRTGLAEAAMWRLAADGLAGAFLEIGVAIGMEDAAIARALAIVHSRQSRLFSPDTGFERVTGEGGRTTTFRLRGGCCLFYRTEGAERCDTCGLRDAESRTARLKAHLDRE